ncbi:MAG: flotillin domain-containing protein, partial [Gammaproteobacteria bacterium]
RIAEADEKQYAVDAAGKRAVNEASNVLSEEQIAMQIKLALMRHLPAIIRESVKPMEAIDGIKIMQVEGLTAGNGSSNGHGGDSAGSGAGGGNLADQMVNSALRYRAQSPLVDTLLEEIGLEGGDINGLTSGLDVTPRTNGTKPAAAIDASS